MKLPFDPGSGSLVHDPKYTKGLDWIEPKSTQFHAILKFDRFYGNHRGAMFTDVLNPRRFYAVPPDHFRLLLTKGNIQEANGLIVDGKWEYGTKGGYYYITPIFDEDT